MTNQQQILTVKAFEILETAEAAYYEARMDSNYEFSPRFERTIQRLIRAERRPLYPLVKTPARKVAVVLAALLLVFTLSMSISAVRTSVIEFFINVYKCFFQFFTKIWQIVISNTRIYFSRCRYTNHQRFFCKFNLFWS